MSSDSEKIDEIRKKIKLLYSALEKARSLNADDIMMGAIRRKIFEEQDKLVYEAIRQHKDIPPNWYAGK